MSLPILGATNTPPAQTAPGAVLSPFEQIAQAMTAPANDDSLRDSMAGVAIPPAAILDALAAAKARTQPAVSAPMTGAGADTPGTATPADAADAPSLYQLFLEARTAIRASMPQTVNPALAPLVAAAPPPAPATRSVSEIAAAIAASLEAQDEARRKPGSLQNVEAAQILPIRPVSPAGAAGDRNA